jgi:hypothetical protein
MDASRSAASILRPRMVRVVSQIIDQSRIVGSISPALVRRIPQISYPKVISVHCISSSMFENAAFSLRAFLTSIALTNGYSAYSRKLGH